MRPFITRESVALFSQSLKRGEDMLPRDLSAAE